MSALSPERAAHYTWKPTDIEVSPPVADPRASVRAALGAAGYGMSDADIDRIIAAAQSSP